MASSPHQTQVQDFAAPGSPTAADQQAADEVAPPPAPYLNIDTQLHEQRSRGRSVTSTTATAAAPDAEAVISPDRRSFDSGQLRRRMTRSHTVKKYDEYKSPTRHNWEEPGAEPGVDTRNDDEAAKYHHLHAQCQITVVDYSNERVVCHELDNDSLEAFLSTPKEDWVACRWVNVNGLSWDVIRMLGNHGKLHRLAIEDLMSDKGRTKVDWYSDQAFCE
jgi:Mg2+ and Co2+ transporter CorA